MFGSGACHDFLPLANDYDADIAELGVSLSLALEHTEKLRKEQHRISMVSFRRNKKQMKMRQQSEFLRLEREMKLLVDAVRDAAACSSSSNAKVSPDKTTNETLRELVVQCELLQNANRALRAEIERHETFQKIVVEARQKSVEMETPALLPQSGWRVNLDTGAPSFHFHPFTRAEFDAGMGCFDTELAGSVARTVVTPIGWSIHHRHNVGTQMLQDFGNDCFVFVHNIPGPDKNLRYLYIVQRSQWLLQGGRRRMVLKMAIVDSEAN
ncbi:uncharacterized protein IUM83_09549 [Phytophthora cinnamomi]|uniref:uncharacterized protein n=1 Tax=Phytophthora cinnamomi TaxID=4785 RepID=UPI00355AB11E|nr:hypothetical protein IUM83_09549 [Phytophthora cinnamomi]